MKSILFVCTGNICRSPSADAILRHLAEERGLDLFIDSVGTHGYHVGEQPDHRSMEIAVKRGIEMSFLRARKLEQKDFEKFDLLIAMDNGHLSTMRNLCPPEHDHKLGLFLDYLQGHEGMDVPDPYYGSMKDFEEAFDLIYQGCDSIIRSYTGQ
jgi:protein-tyrosine phosphatase